MEHVWPSATQLSNETRRRQRCYVAMIVPWYEGSRPEVAGRYLVIATLTATPSRMISAGARHGTDGRLSEVTTTYRRSRTSRPRLTSQGSPAVRTQGRLRAAFDQFVGCRRVWTSIVGNRGLWGSCFRITGRWLRLGQGLAEVRRPTARHRKYCCWLCPTSSGNLPRLCRS